MVRERTRLRRAARGALACAFALAAAGAEARAQSLSPEFRLSGSATGADLLTASDTRVAFDGENYVVAWNDTRRRAESVLSSPSLLVTRVTPSGELLDPNGIVAVPDVGVIGSNTRVMQRAPWGSAFLLGSGRLLRLDREARPMGELVSVPLGAQSQTVSCSERDCLLSGVGLFELSEPMGDVKSARRTRGSVLDACGELVAGAVLDMPPGDWSAAFGGEVHLLVGLEENTADALARSTPRASAVARDGTLLWGPLPLAAPPAQTTTVERFVLAYGQARFVVVWRQRTDQRSELWATTVTPSGPSGEAFRLIESSSELELGGVAWEGSRFRVVYRVEGEVRTLHLDEAGELLAEGVLVPASHECVPSDAQVAAGAAESLVVWSWGSGTEPCRRAAALLVPNDDAQPPRPVPFVRSSAPVASARFATDGNAYLAAWFEPRQSAPGVYFRRLALDGTPDPAPPTLALPLDAAATPLLSNTFADGQYRIGADDRFVFVDAETLSVRDGSVEPCGAQPRASLELDREQGERAEDVPATQRLIARRVDLDACGAVAASEQTWRHESPDYSVDDSIVSAFDGERWAVVWSHWGGVSDDAILFMSFDRDARPLLDTPRELAGVTGVPLVLSWNQGAHLLVTNDVARASGNGLAAHRLSPDGDQLDAAPAGFADSGNGASIGAVVALPDRDGWRVAWEQAMSWSANVGAARLDAGGSVVWSGLVANAPEHESLVALVPSGGPSALLAYARFDPQPDFVAQSLFYRVLDTEGCPPLAACAPEACDACCPGGCQPAPEDLECSPPSCGSGCDAGERCVEGLGCLPDGAAPRASSVRTSGGCGCRVSPISTSPSALLFWTLAGLMLLSRSRRQTRPFWRRGFASKESVGD